MGNFNTRTVRVIAWLLCLYMWASNCFLWGGVALSGTRGERVDSEARLNSPMLATYMGLGKMMVNALGAESSAQKHAQAQLPALFAEPAPQPRQYVDVALSAQSGFDRRNYLGAPLLLVLSFALHASRQKQLRSFGRKG